MAVKSNAPPAKCQYVQCALEMTHNDDYYCNDLFQNEKELPTPAAEKSNDRENEMEFPTRCFQNAVAKSDKSKIDLQSYANRY